LCIGLNNIFFEIQHSLLPCTTYESKTIKITDEAFPRRFQRYIHVKLPSHENLALLMEKKMAGYHHTVTRPEFKYLAKKLIGFGPTDIHKIPPKDMQNLKKVVELWGNKIFLYQILKTIQKEVVNFVLPSSSPSFS
jgi:AAA+ superfamily predicted ATPase